MDQLDIRVIKPAAQDEFINTHNPVYTGSVLLKLALLYHDTGLSLANHHLSIFATAHLYNALRQLHMLQDKWHVMDRIIELHKRALFADAIPTRTADMADRLKYRLDATRKTFFRDEKYKFNERDSFQALKSMLDPSISNGKALYQIEQQAIDHYKNSLQPTKGAAAFQRRKQQFTPVDLVGSLQDALTPVLDDLSIDYIRLTKRCIRLLGDFTKLFNVHLISEGVDEIRCTSVKDRNNTNDQGHLIIAFEALQEAKSVREMGIYNYRAGEGEVNGYSTAMNDDPDDEYRRGMGLLTASQLFRRLLTKENTEFRFLPLASPQARALTSVDPNEAYGAYPTHNEEGVSFVQDQVRCIITASSAAELQKLLGSTTYAAVDFFADWYFREPTVPQTFFEMAHKHGIPGVLMFAPANTDDMRDFAAKHQVKTESGFLFFKDGRQVAVDGKTVVGGRDLKGLRAAAVKLGGLAKKRAAPAS
ncbi:Uu.00g030720.m01.CDS01 [Anthostomella pinea]|uniref:Uu.00g030720.m01.CDS01 n=1 Tax=Anthostomella pinea TaxID=933095 RepID=A0AAI8YAL5_9PEZI|nr:Uu.00g030720.m01.CDS01 [Anthostomella pinea]